MGIFSVDLSGTSVILRVIANVRKNVSRNWNYTELHREDTEFHREILLCLSVERKSNYWLSL
jgi:hypothetical protein